jgi:hypothetical protein
MALPTLEVPTYELTLPSTGKKITYRPFLVKEHKILLTLSEASDDETSRIVTDLVDVCTFNKINAKELPHFDIEYIFMFLRARSISEVVDVVITCVNCEKQYDNSFNIENILIEKADDHTNKIMLNDTVGIEMKYPKFDQVVKVFDNNDTDDIFKLVMKSIKGIFEGDNYWDAKEQTEEDIETFLNSLTKEQFEKIETFFQSAPKIVQVIESDCPHCQHHNTSRIQGLQNFFV